MNLKEIKDRLLNKISINLKTGCWEWVGATDDDGYGQMMIGSKIDHTRKPTRAHRLAYQIFVGEIPKGLYVCHKCDNPPCVNPNHLFLGTHAQNMADMVRKGRLPDESGARNPRAKLTELDVINMRNKRKTTGLSYAKIARIYGVVPSVAQKAIKGESWKNVPLPEAPEGVERDG